MVIYSRIFGELRFPGQIDIYDGNAKVVKSFFPQAYRHWNIDKNIVKLFNGINFQESKETLFIDHQRFLYNIEDPENDESFHKSFFRNFTTLKDSVRLRIKDFDRVGIRSLIKIGYIDFESFIEKSKSDSIFCKQFLDIIKMDHNDIHITLQNDNNRINLGPMKQSEQHPNYYNQFVEKDNMKGDYLMFDIDCFKNNVSLNDLRSTLNELNSNICKFRDNFISFFEEDFINE